MLENFPTVIAVLRNLDQDYQNVIKQITNRMGSGMAKIIKKAEVQRGPTHILTFTVYGGEPLRIFSVYEFKVMYH